MCLVVVLWCKFLYCFPKLRRSNHIATHYTTSEFWGSAAIRHRLHSHLLIFYLCKDMHRYSSTLTSIKKFQDFKGLYFRFGHILCRQPCLLVLRFWWTQNLGRKLRAESFKICYPINQLLEENQDSEFGVFTKLWLIPIT